MLEEYFNAACRCCGGVYMIGLMHDLFMGKDGDKDAPWGLCGKCPTVENINVSGEEIAMCPHNVVANEMLGL